MDENDNTKKTYQKKSDNQMKNNDKIDRQDPFWTFDMEFRNTGLTKEIVDKIIEIAEQFNYTVEYTTEMISGNHYYDMYFNHKANERLNFNAYGISIAEIEDSIYWHCLNGKENLNPLTDEEADKILLVRDALIDFYKTFSPA